MACALKSWLSTQGLLVQEGLREKLGDDVSLGEVGCFVRSFALSSSSRRVVSKAGLDHSAKLSVFHLPPWDHTQAFVGINRR